ncbi:MAG: malto-oligosyltrehalose synthase [Desulfosalsimonas sp.]|uniref:malto-oligosyltrehalose synthase n=1 Tax=Desulfosalsimonas sp. TaxID=3073848 RepID=UPI003970DEF7
MTPQTENHIPRATYRLQFHPGFTFDHAAQIADYLAALGVSHVYASPYLQAAPGSTHGYDVTDPSRVNAELGGQSGHDRFCSALANAGLGQVIDIVPNHMAVSHPAANKWWWDVLKNGPASAYAGYFDIDWNPPENRMAGKILLPILEDQYGRVLEAGKIRVAVCPEQGLVCRYHDHVLPLRHGFAENIADHADPACRAAVLADHFNTNINALDNLLENQHYRLASWRAASQDINYRRFFAINSLAGVRVEDPAVFEATHARILDWAAQGRVCGLRIDHPDGLKDPEQYLSRLQSAAPDAWIVVEKILHPGEDLPGSWPAAGTTGYDFLNLVTGLFVDPANKTAFTGIYEKFTSRKTSYPDLAHACKHRVMEDLLGAEISRLTHRLVTICENHRCFRDHTRKELFRAICRMLACMPVYRTYVRENIPADSADTQVIARTAAEAKSRQPETDPRLFDFLADLCCGRIVGEAETQWMLLFQQVSGPVTAKGIEDTAFYRYHRLICLNEVGGDPEAFGLSAGAFHEAMISRQKKCPAAMLATSTHDTKRSEDVRARLALLSEIPDQWGAAVRRWAAHNAMHKTGHLPDANIEYLFYQSLVGAWPMDADRACAFIQKAAREAREFTCWEQPDEAYEDALLAFVRNLLADSFFMSDFEAFVDPLIFPGRINSLSQTLVKLTAPGVPDLYQGTELWDLSLVDPDNRRPVDFARRRHLLKSIKDMTLAQILADMDSGLPKLFLTSRVLGFRTQHPHLFSPNAQYQPVHVTGPHQDHSLAYLRGKQAAVIVPRLIMNFPGHWADTRVRLPGGQWKNILTNQTAVGPEFRLQDILSQFPVALMARSN